MSTRVLILDAQIITALGGPTVVAKALGLSRNGVHNWTTRGVPRYWKPHLRKMAKRAGVELPEEWGL